MERVGTTPGKPRFSTGTMAENFAGHAEDTAVTTVTDACAAVHRYQFHGGKTTPMARGAAVSIDPEGGRSVAPHGVLRMCPSSGPAPAR